MRAFSTQAFPAETSNDRPSQPLRWHAGTVEVIGICAFVLAGTAAASMLHLRGPDYAAMHLLNHFAGRSVLFDDAMYFLTRDMFSSVLLISMVVYTWFQTDEMKRRAAILSGVLLSFAAGMFSRILQLVLPTHLRPLHDPELHFTAPMYVDSHVLNHWSSFPSDHAAIYFGLAATAFLANRRVGWAAIGFAAMLNCVRIYRGFHFPSDVLSGAMLGVVVVLLAHELRLWRWTLRLVDPRSSWKPLFYAVCVYLCFGVGTLFIDYRDLATNVSHLVKAHGHPPLTEEANSTASKALE